jgi:hypothetical protein
MKGRNTRLKPSNAEREQCGVYVQLGFELGRVELPGAPLPGIPLLLDLEHDRELRLAGRVAKHVNAVGVEGARDQHPRVRRLRAGVVMVGNLDVEHVRQ